MPFLPRTIPLTGKLITAVDGTLIGENFQKLENLRYDPLPKGIKGMTKINSTPTAKTNIKSGHHFRKVEPQVESHTLVQASGGGSSSVYDNTTAAPGTGNFTELRADTAGSGAGRFDTTSVESIAYCNGEESLIWSGDKMRVASFFIASTSNTKANFLSTNRAEFLNLSKNVQDRIDANFSTLPDSTETQLFVGAVHRLKSVNFTLLAGPPDRYTTPLVEYYNGTAWTAVSNLVDTTSVTGFTLKQSGSYTFDDTQAVAKPVILDSLQLYWYRITFGTHVSVAGDIKVSHLDVSANMQPIEDLWDGGIVPLAVYKRSSAGGNDVVNITEDNYDTNNNATWVELNGGFGNGNIELPPNENSFESVLWHGGELHLLSAQGQKIYVLSGSPGEEVDLLRVIDLSNIIDTSSGGNGVATSLSIVDRSIKGDGTQPNGSKFQYFILTANPLKYKLVSFEGKLMQNSTPNYNSVNPGSPKCHLQTLTSGIQRNYFADAITNTLYITKDYFSSATTTISLAFSPSYIREVSFSVSFQQTVIAIGHDGTLTETFYDIDGVQISTGNLPAKPVSFSDSYFLHRSLDSFSNVLLSSVGNINTVSSLAFTNRETTIGSFQRLSGVKINLIPCNVNTRATSSPITVTANKLGSTSPVILNGVIDTTRSGDFTIPLNRSGLITWEPLKESEEIQVSIEGLSLYTYTLNIAGGLSLGTKAYHVVGIPAPKEIKPYTFPVNAHDRLWLCDQTKDKRNSILVSSQFTDMTFSGEDSNEFRIGDSLPVVAAASVKAGLVVCKHGETWSIIGNNPSDWIVKNISMGVGCSSPLTMKSIVIKGGNGEFVRMTMWQDSNGVYMSDGNAVSKISFDIDDIFDPDNPTRINSLGISSAFFDVDRKEYHLLYPEYPSTSINREIVFDIKTQSWYTINRGINKQLNTGFKVIDVTGNYYNYGGDSSGNVYRLENGTGFDGNDIVHVLKTADIRLTAETTMQTILRRVNLLQGAKNTTANKIVGTHFGDTSGTGSSFSMNIKDTARRVKLSRSDVNFGYNTHHAIQLSMSTNDETSGFEPQELVAYYTMGRKEK